MVADCWACRKCHRLDYSSSHRNRSIPGYHRVLYLRRRIGADPCPFSPIAPRPLHHRRYWRIAHEIAQLEAGLVGHIREDISDVLERRRAIAKSLHCTIADVNDALDRFAATTITEKLRTHTLALELERLDGLQQVFERQAKAGDVASGHLVTQLIERRSIMLGLAAPPRADPQIIEMQTAPAVTSTERIRAAIERIRGLPKPEPEPDEGKTN